MTLAFILHNNSPSPQMLTIEEIHHETKNFGILYLVRSLSEDVLIDYESSRVGKQGELTAVSDFQL